VEIDGGRWWPRARCLSLGICKLVAQPASFLDLLSHSDDIYVGSMDGR